MLLLLPCVLIAICSRPVLGRQPPRPDKTAKTAASRSSEGLREQLGRWVRRLDDSRFGVRNRSTTKLIEAGKPAVEPVLEAVRTGNLEVSTRGVYVLRELAYGSDLGAQKRSLDALREIARSFDKPLAARRARKAIAGFDKAREQKAIQKLTRLGASIESCGPTRFGGPAPGHLEVEIGPDWKGDRQDLNLLAWIQNLKKITLAGPQVTDAWIETIGARSGLHYLVIKNAQITDEALRTVGQIKTLVYVDLMYTPVTNDGLAYLEEMKSVRMIRCFGTKITQKAAQQLAAKLGQAEVQHKMGGFLGVRCEPAPEPCRVILVTPGSGADRGGIRRKDIITQFDGQPVPTFDALERLIARKRVGDTVKIQVRRGGQAMAPEISRQPDKPLGLEGSSTPIGVNVDGVKPGGAAAEAKIRPGDLILALDRRRISSVAQLQDQYARQDPGWTGRCLVLRNSQTKNMQVTLGQWNE